MKFQSPILNLNMPSAKGPRHTGIITYLKFVTDGLTDKPKPICPFNFFKVGGIKMETSIFQFYIHAHGDHIMLLDHFCVNCA